jgi:amidase
LIAPLPKEFCIFAAIVFQNSRFINPKPMKRRTFLQSTTVGIAGIWALFNFSCKPGISDQKENSSPNETFNDDFELNEITIDQLQEKMQSGDYTSRSIVEMYLKRIDALDKNGPKLNSIIELNPEALNIADAMDNERKKGKIRGPMHGIPILLKDNIDTADELQTTAGSIALEGNKAAKDAFIVTLLRDAGAVILGKTNLSEWANFRSTRSSSGWSSRGGQTRHPFILYRNPCGSSSGSGVAVSANLCTVAVGTETDGSVVCPSGINGIVGIKPTVGLVSRSGIIPISASQDTAGPMARTVRDAALLLGILTGIDPEDTVTAESYGKSKKDYTKSLDPNGLNGKRIGIDPSCLKIHEAVDTLMQKALNTMKNMGAIMVEIDFIKKVDELGVPEFELLEFEFKDGLNRYLSQATGQVKSLKELIEFNIQNEKLAMPYFKQEILESAENRGGLDSKEYMDIVKKLLSCRDIIDNLMNVHRLDAICGPTNAPSWPIDLVNGDHYVWGFSTAAAISGYPSITVPAGLTFELPIGLTFFGKAYTEHELLKIAYAFEQKSKQRVAPKFLKEIYI